MKIMHVITRSELGGAQYVVVNLANEQSREHEVLVTAGSYDGKLWPLLSTGITKIPMECLKREVCPDDFKAWYELRKLYKKYRPDIIHLHSSKAGLLGRLAFPACRTIYTVHGFDSIRLVYRKYLFLEKLLQYKCKRIAGVSRHDLLTMANEGITRNVSFIYNGIVKPDSSGITDIITQQGFRKTVLCIARVAKPKRLDIFLKTASLLPQYAFVWIGNKEEINDHPANVFFKGSIPDAGKYACFADLLFLTSDYEGLPIVILEAMSHGLPVVASDVGGVSEMVISDYNGFCLENSAELFAEKIEYILSNEDISAKFSENSLMLFEKEFTARKMVAEYYKLYFS